MVEVTNDEDLLSPANKEKFRRRLSIASRIIAIGLICAILWIGWIQISYANEIRQINGKYGSLSSCYLCGKEQFRSCTCNYEYDLVQRNTNLSVISEMIALGNVQVCPYKEDKVLLGIRDLSPFFPLLLSLGLFEELFV